MQIEGRCICTDFKAVSEELLLLGFTVFGMICNLCLALGKILVGESESTHAWGREGMVREDFLLKALDHPQLLSQHWKSVSWKYCHRKRVTQNG